jgi:glycosyltransferase involved in cell wall biosynthesis
MNITYIKYTNASLYKTNKTEQKFSKRIIIAIQQSPRMFIRLWRVLAKRHPTVVHRTCSGSLSFFRDIFFGILSNSYGARSVVHFHFGRIPDLCNKQNWEYKIMCMVIRYSYKTIVIDSPSYIALCKVGFSDKIVLIPNPCAQDVEKIAHETISPKKNDSYIFVGHLIKTKGIYELVNAFAKVPDRLDLTMIGPYNNKDKINLEQIAKKKADGIWLHIIGPKDKSYILNAMKSATAMVFPTYTEGFPNVVLESMACGCPILASKVAAIPDMLNNDDSSKSCGICFKSKSVDEIIVALNLFRSNKNIHSLYAINGKKKVLKEYTMETVFPMYEKIWNINL